MILEIVMRIDYELGSDETLDNVEHTMKCAIDTIVNDQFLTGHGNLDVIVCNYDWRIRQPANQLLAIPIDCPSICPE